MEQFLIYKKRPPEVVAKMLKARIGRYGRSVLDDEGRLFKSRREAGVAYGVSPQAISWAIKHGRRVAGHLFAGAAC